MANITVSQNQFTAESIVTNLNKVLVTIEDEFIDPVVQLVLLSFIKREIEGLEFIMSMPYTGDLNLDFMVISLAQNADDKSGTIELLNKILPESFKI